ncbi:hypothetical protein FB45DRAFT_999737 [Roridomyces roridus]|uniref:F-box domain-containing protein n=1 Tax=Roridomyces roridus TaxID=1738132 RepID=A0AAD7CCV3_9AGAR|nr:hypothetical protein FB45DRAFT_999737 [Roridomyces roridus]
MGTLNQVPPEMWVKILDGLPPSTLRAVYDSTKFLKGVSSGLIHSHFTFHPYYRKNATSVIRLRSDANVQAALERLDYWSANEIVRHVRSCSLEPWETTFETKRAGAIFDTDEPLVLLDAFFQRLPSFTGLTRFHADRVHFSADAVTTLRGLPLLRDIQISLCTVAWDEEAPSQVLALTNFAIHPHHDMSTDVTGDFNFWINSLRTDVLRKLEVQWNPQIPFQHIHIISSFRALVELSIDVDLSHITLHFLSLLSQLRIRVLGLSDSKGHRISLQSDETQQLPVPFIPTLTDYCGPIHTLHIFLRCPGLTRLITHDGDNVELMLLLQSHAPPRITSLTATFIRQLQWLSFEEMLKFLPHLTELRINAKSGSPETLTQLLDTLAHAVNLPRSLTRLALILESLPPLPDARTPLALPNYAPLRAVLAGRCTAFERLWISHARHVYSWRPRNLDGVEEERAVEVPVCVCAHLDGGLKVDAMFEGFWGL